MSKKRGKKAYTKGVALENRVARWLKTQFGYECEKRDLARGKISKRPYEIDVRAIKKGLLGLGRTDVWVECKAHRVKRTHVTKLVESARDVRDAFEDDIENWSPDMLMLVSDEGFDVDALGLANKYCIYCVEAGNTFQFMGEMNREDFGDKEGSDY